MRATSRTSGKPVRRQRVCGQKGFTLLEVMCAFAILAMITSFMAASWADNMDKASNAVAKRELREVADTIFRRILYEQHDHADGTTGNLEDFYGEWTGFKGAEREKWRAYTFELTKRIKTAAGASDEEGNESTFGDENADEDETGSGSSGAEGEEEANVSLTQITVKIYYTEEQGSEPLITLSTYIKPDGTEDK